MGTVWKQHLDLPVFPQLRQNTAADVCVIGGGITGVTTAYLLALEGYSVVLLEGRRIAQGETGCTTAHLSTVVDSHYYHLEKWHGEKTCRQVAESHGAAIDLIEKIIAQEKIACGFRRLNGFLFVPPPSVCRHLREGTARRHDGRPD